MALHLNQKLKLRHLRAIRAIADHQSLQRASATIGVTQPALTKTLRDVEEICGARLFDRTARGVEINAFGDVVVRSAQRILAEAARLEEDLERLASSKRSELAIGAYPVTAAGLLPGVLVLMRQRLPTVAARVTKGSSQEIGLAFDARQVDVIAGRLYDVRQNEDVEQTTLYNETIGFVARAGHPIFEHELVPESLAAYDLVVPSLQWRGGEELVEALDCVPVDLRRWSIRSASLEFVREVLHESDAIAIMPLLFMAGDLLRGALRVIPISIPSPARPAGITFRRRERADHWDEFVSCVRDHVDRLRDAGIVA